MTAELTDLPASLLRLDELLAEAGDEAMLLSELDGFLCGLAVSPEPIARDEWWPLEWLSDERGELRSGAEELASLIEARHAEIEQELAEDRYAPLFEVDDESEAVIWEAWVAGFQQAMILRFEAWDALLRDTESGGDRGEAAMGLASALMMASPDVGPEETAGEEEWAEYEEMIEDMPAIIASTATLLFQLHRQG
ncbi:MAG: YecA family protein [Devosia sp.]|nr:YecA family protein [Devosia sp.]